MPEQAALDRSGAAAAALLLQAFYTIRSERQLIDNSLHVLIAGRRAAVDEPVSVPTVFPDRDRLLDAGWRGSSWLSCSIVEGARLVGRALLGGRRAGSSLGVDEGFREGRSGEPDPGRNGGGFAVEARTTHASTRTLSQHRRASEKQQLHGHALIGEPHGRAELAQADGRRSARPPKDHCVVRRRRASRSVPNKGYDASAFVGRSRRST